MIRVTSWLVVVALLSLAGCAANGSGADNQKNSGMYGGVSGGWSHP